MKTEQIGQKEFIEYCMVNHCAQDIVLFITGILLKMIIIFGLMYFFIKAIK